MRFKSTLLIFLISIQACQGDGENFESGGNAGFESNVDNLGPMISVPISFGTSVSGLNLATPADQFTMSVEGCVSGLSYPLITETNPSIDMYTYDQGCKAKLLSFVMGGKTYTPVVGSDFSHLR